MEKQPFSDNNLMSPARLEGESYEKYKERQKIIKQFLKIYKRHGVAGADRIVNYIEELNERDARPRFTDTNGPSTFNNGGSIPGGK